MTLDPRPAALLLDFGGVIVSTTKRTDGPRAAAAHTAAILRRGGIEIPEPDLERSIVAGLTALKHWKHASSRRLAPRELSHREIVGDFLATDLPARARHLLVAESSELLDAFATLLSDHRVRPGIRDVLDAADRAGVGLGIVSNAHSGRSHRRILAELGLEGRFAVQVYSDEVGIRKPHPAMLERAATALGVPVERCWYVGDTMDRDVVAGRRAGVGRMIVTRDKHTDTPPFPVAASPDVILDSPAGLARLLDAVLAGGTFAASGGPASASAPQRQGALFIDHGGVISQSRPDPAALRAFGAHLARLLTSPGTPVSVDDALGLIERASHARRAVKAGRPTEVTPTEFWGDHVGSLVDARGREVLLAEAHDLMYRYGLAKSVRRMREGVPELLRHCRATGRMVVVVSNTLSGRAVRQVCADHGITDLIGAFVCSDEVGFRKPDPRILAEALAVSDADPDRSWFYGDKPGKDARAAVDAGITHRVLVRGGSTPDPALDDAVADGSATAVVDSAHDLLDLMRVEDSLLAS